MSELKNGFYTYIPNKEAAEGMHELSTPQVIEIFEGEVHIIGIDESFDIDYVNALGEIGKIVMNEDGKIF